MKFHNRVRIRDSGGKNRLDLCDGFSVCAVIIPSKMTFRSSGETILTS